MPPMKCCGKTWSVGSDDFVITSIIGIILHTVWLGGLIAFALMVLVGRDCFPEGPREDIVFTFIYSQIAIQALVIISEGMICFISSRGTISDPEPRDLLPHFLRLRAILYTLEILGIGLGGYVAWSPYIQDHVHCERSNRVRQAIEAYVISVIVVHVIIAILFMIFFDPLGFQTPSLLKELHVFHNEDSNEQNEGNVTAAFKLVQRKKLDDNTTEVVKKTVTKRLYSTNSWKRWGRRAKFLCCCIGNNNSASKKQALEDIAHAMATMFDGVNIVPTDFIAALMLVHRNQKDQMKRKCDLGAQVKRITFKRMEESEENQFTEGYDRDSHEVNIDSSTPNIKSQLEDIRHYLKFALGIYGWPIHVYLSPFVGSACLCANLKCRLLHKRAKDFLHDNCCLANTAAFGLRSKLKNQDMIYISYKNDIHWPPFSLCVDHTKNVVVLSIRGTMSLRDALTDMNISMESIKVNDKMCNGRVTRVHSGMRQAALNIRTEIDEKLRNELNSPERRGYKFIITGHSLGAGVAAILAVLYQEEFQNRLHCYAFSPPGSLFTLPLVEYSKSFITTIIYGNDIVPRLTFRSLLYLKRTMTHLVKHCTAPKHAILCPRLFWCCYQRHYHVNHEELKDDDIYDHSTEVGIFKTPRQCCNRSCEEDTSKAPRQKLQDFTDSMQKALKYGKKWQQKAKEGTLHKFVEHMYSVEKTPAFLPGKVLYIRQDGCQRSWNIFRQKKVYAVWMPNKEFCHITVDKGILDDHMPDSVQEAVERLYCQMFGAQATKSKTTLNTKSDKDNPYHCSNVEPNGFGETSTPGSKPDNRYNNGGMITTPHENRNTIEMSTLGSEPDNRNNIEVNGGTITTPHGNGNTIEVIVHNSPEDYDKPQVKQEESTSL